MSLVTKLDRLARSTRDLLNTLAAIGDRGAGFKSRVIRGRIRPRHGKLMITVLGDWQNSSVIQSWPGPTRGANERRHEECGSGAS